MTNKLYRDLIQEKTYLQTLLLQVNNELENAPSENLRISHKKGKCQYYLCSPEIFKKQRNGKYIKRKDEHIAREIAQRDYNTEIKTDIEKRLKLVDQLIQNLKTSNLEDAFDSQNDYRKKLITPIIEPINDYIANWLNQEYKAKGFAEGTPEIYSDKGHRVRSKSEKIIADYLYRNNIPYLYEKPIQLLTNRFNPIVVYPDFTILDINERKEIYVEHFGLMDNPEYVKNALEKLSSYELSGIHVGDRFLFTYETSSRPFDVRLLANRLQKLNIGVKE